MQRRRRSAEQRASAGRQALVQTRGPQIRRDRTMMMAGMVGPGLTARPMLRRFIPRLGNLAGRMFLMERHGSRAGRLPQMQGAPDHGNQDQNTEAAPHDGAHIACARRKDQRTLPGAMPALRRLSDPL